MSQAVQAIRRTDPSKAIKYGSFPIETPRIVRLLSAAARPPLRCINRARTPQLGQPPLPSVWDKSSIEIHGYISMEPTPPLPGDNRSGVYVYIYICCTRNLPYKASPIQRRRKDRRANKEGQLLVS